MNPVRFGIALIIALTLAITILSYPALPDQIPSHWNITGEVDGYLAKPWGVLIVPLVMVPLTALLFLLPRIDPLRENYAKFRRQYEGFILVFAAFFFIVQLQIILWGLDYPVSPTLLFPLIAGALFGRYSLWFVLVPVLAVSVYLVIYSYLEFRNETGTPG